MAAQVMDLWTRLWDRYHVSQNVFLVVVCIRKSHIVYWEKYAVPISHGLSFVGHGNVSPFMSS